MKKIIDIKEELIVPLKILAAKQNKDLKNYLQDIIENNVNLLNPDYKDNWENFKSNKPHNQWGFFLLNIKINQATFTFSRTYGMSNDDDFKLLSNLYHRKYLSEDETLVLAEGFDNAIIGITTQAPKRIIYNYWECVDTLLRLGDEDNQLDFDTSMVYLDNYIEEMSSVKEFAPIFIKII